MGILRMSVDRRARVLPGEVLPGVVLIAAFVLGDRGYAAPAAVVATTSGISVADDEPFQSEMDDLMGVHELLFVGRAGPSGAVLRSGPNPNYGVVRRADPGALLIAVSTRDDGYVNVIAPDGYLAYVHSDYVDVDEDGVGVVNSDRVNLRSQPSSRGDYPVAQMDRGTEVLVWQRVGDGDKWLQVTAPEGVPVWTTRSELGEEGALDAGLVEEVRTLQRARTNAWEQRSAESAERAAARRAFEKVPEVLTAASTAIDAERKKGSDADFTAARGLIESALALESSQLTLPAELRAEADRLTGTIEAVELVRDQEKQRLALLDRLAQEEKRLSAAASAPLPPPLPAVAQAPVPPPLQVGSRGRHTGFLRLRADSTGVSSGNQTFALERGANVIAWVGCSTGRYRLADFAGKQVVVHGTVSGSSASPFIEVDRLEIVP